MTNWGIMGYPGQPEIHNLDEAPGTRKRVVAIIPQWSGHPFNKHPETDSLAELFVNARSTLAERDALRDFAKRLLNPEDLGYAVSAEIRDAAREALGMRRVET